MTRICLICLIVAVIQTQPGFASDRSYRDRYSPVSVSICFYQDYISDLHYGHCRFTPSCSHYALEAFETYGVVSGAVHTADRLVRCNSGAKRFYPADSDGRLLDPVIGGNTKKQLLVPGWLLPPDEKPPSSIEDWQSNGTRDSLCEATESPMKTIPLSRHIAFADFLAQEGDCERAITEYKYVAFEVGTDDVLRWSKMRSGECYYRLKQWDSAAEEFLEATRISENGIEQNIAFFMAAACRFNAQRYDNCNKLLKLCSRDTASNTAVDNAQVDSQVGHSSDRLDPSRADAARPLSSGRIDFLRGLAFMAQGEWETGMQAMETITAHINDSPYAGSAAALSERAKNAGALPGKSPTLAMILSAIIPGSGQFYAGRANDGLRHLIFNGLLGYGVYKLVDNENYTGAYLLAGVTLPFYAGNIAGAKRSAEYYTRSKRIETISKWIDEAGRH